MKIIILKVVEIKQLGKSFFSEWTGLYFVRTSLNIYNNSLPSMVEKKSNNWKTSLVSIFCTQNA